MYIFYLSYVILFSYVFLKNILLSYSVLLLNAFVAHFILDHMFCTGLTN